MYNLGWPCFLFFSFINIDERASRREDQLATYHNYQRTKTAGGERRGPMRKEEKVPPSSNFALQILP